MARPVLYVAITNHGFGHVTRTAALINAIQSQIPDLLPLVVTAAPHWLLRSHLQGEFIHRPRSLDIGVVQRDSLQMDIAATHGKLAQIEALAPQIIAAEVDFITQNKASLVLADIPPLATAIAEQAAIPCWMASNFGWDFIYAPWGNDFRERVAWIEDLYRRCDRLFRLPFAEPMEEFPVIEDIGLTGTNPRFEPAELREELQITTDPEKTILLTFGGLSLQHVPYQNLDQFPDWQFITCDPGAPEGLANLRKLCGQDYRPVDLMGICGRVLCKPGYGTFSEACRVGLPITTITRDDFAEGKLLIQGIQDYAYHQVLSPDEFFDTSWDFLHGEPQAPRQQTPLKQDGNRAIATAVRDFFHGNFMLAAS
ncbi:glycosyl transferase [Candidatus Synechococcus calcipolaris G9]|uniref:Glycosyl transferase n=1 Tax=Candidatus Synechococcus calcipolaris G9 TaxID=1497997 RepID=A0ABT6EZS4_9SYNE|nr:glycosyl transferase [Candidatus Synechococcus calcipolaris]MDG2991114.1 glycosyl transferase [Candidatus Synechococcus calcipolaris G9]